MNSSEAGSAPATHNRPDIVTSSTPESESVSTALSGLAAAAAAAVNNFLTLVTLEAKRAALSLMWMVGLGVVAALLAITAWLGLMGALACAAVALGLPWGLALVLVALINVLAAFIIMRKASGMSTELLFPATRRQLQTIVTRPGQR